jgi:hypothetical protein
VAEVERALAAVEDQHGADRVLLRDADRQVVEAVVVEVADRERMAEELAAFGVVGEAIAAELDREALEGDEPAGVPFGDGDGAKRA